MLRYSALLAIGLVACSSASGVDTPADAGTGGTTGTGGTGGAVDSGTGGTPMDAAVDTGGGTGGFGGGMLEGSADAPSCTAPTPEGRCDTFPQCGCDVGQKCDILDLMSGRTACTRDGVGLAFQACSQFSPCAAGLFCLGGSCRPFCDTNIDCPGVGQECQEIQANFGGMPLTIPGARVCSAGCDPREPDLVCGPGLGCLMLMSGATDCFSVGTGMGPGACTGGGTLDCAPGYQCVDNAGSQDCLKWCRTNNPNDCDMMAGEVCGPLAMPPVFMGDTLGVCITPP